MLSEMYPIENPQADHFSSRQSECLSEPENFKITRVENVYKTFSKIFQFLASGQCNGRNLLIENIAFYSIISTTNILDSVTEESDNRSVLYSHNAILRSYLILFE